MAIRAMALYKIVLTTALLGLTACSNTLLDNPVDMPVSTLGDKAVIKKVSFDDLPNWENDDLNALWPAWQKSCEVIQKRSPQVDLGADPQWGKVSDWQSECEASKAFAANPRGFFETRFTPLSITSSTSLFTGYYEASLAGSPVKTMRYQTPIYGIPSDFVTANLVDFSDKYDGKTVLKGRVKGNKFVPYANRSEIESAPLDAPIIAYVEDPIGLFFMHIQGSGRIHFENGQSIRVGYAEQNGHDYVAIGKVLKERGDLTDVSLQTIKAWMANNPDKSQALMNENPSFIFFRKLDNGDGPIGAQNIALTPMRSIAIDKSKYAYGLPFYVETTEPALTRLMIAQDTGGAIKGNVRADIFWGYGAEAEDKAGIMQSRGRYWALIPNSIVSNF